MFLIRDKHPSASAHYWDGRDTACKMWSTGGLNKNRKWAVHATPGNHPICTMCANVQRKRDARNGLNTQLDPLSAAILA